MSHEQKQPKILGIITARGGSKGIPGKSVKKLGDKPLIAYTIDVAKKSTLLTHLIVSTDSEEIAYVCKEYGVDVPFMRPKELAEDTTPHLPVVQHAVDFMEKKESSIYDSVVILQPTSPFRTVDDIDATVQKLIDADADSAVSMCEIEGDAHPMKMKKMEGDKVLPYVIEETTTLRQELPVVYKRNSAVYVIKRDVVMKENRLFLDGKIVGHLVPKERSLDIDVPLDWIEAEYTLGELKKKGYEF